MNLFYIRKILSIMILFCVLTAAVSGQEKQNITVLPFLASDVPTYLPLVVGRIIEEALKDTSAFNVIGQDELRTILAEDYDSYLDCVDLDCAIKIGEKLSAEQIIVGTVSSSDIKSCLSCSFTAKEYILFNIAS